MRPLAPFVVILATLGCSSESSDPRAAADAGADAVDALPTLDAGRDADASLLLDATTDAAPTGPRDRAGRPLVSRLLVSEANRDGVAQSTDPFNVDTGSSGDAAVGNDMRARISALDALDGKTDWAVEDALALFAADVLVVDPGKPFSPSGYLEIESTSGGHLTCGGRFPSDDAIDKTMSFVVTRALVGVSDGVPSSPTSPSLTFPYLAAPR